MISCFFFDMDTECRVEEGSEVILARDVIASSSLVCYDIPEGWMENGCPGITTRDHGTAFCMKVDSAFLNLEIREVDV